MEQKTVPYIKDQKGKRKLTMLTAYDYIMASILDEQDVDMILVGDSVGTTILGYPNTIPVTIEEMIHHTKAVVKATKNALVIIDMPFMSYQESVEQAKRNAGKMMKESLAGAVKLEGGQNMKDTIKAIVDIDIPVIGHVGLTPQSIHRMGGYKVQGKGKEAERLIQDAISQVVKGRTSIVIAHRLSTVRHADRIIVIDKGQIAEEGNHRSLMAEKGLYYDLYRLQFAD